MKRQLIIAFFLICLVFGLGSAAIINNLLNSTNSLQDLLVLHKIEDIRQNLNLRVQKVQSYVHLSALDFSYNLDEVVSNIQGLAEASENCLSCHHEKAVEKDILYTQNLIRDYEEKLSYIITSANDDTWRRENQKQAVKLSDTIIYHVQDMVNRSASTLQRKTDSAMRQINKTYLFLSVTMVSTVIMAMLIGQHLTQKITTPIDKLLLATKKLATGDLGYTTEYQGNDDFVRLHQSFNEMSLALADKDKENTELTKSLQRKIDELHNAQHQLLISEKLASLGRLADGISHDFNNILCGILGYISILKQQLDGRNSATETLATLEKASIRASHLVKKLQSFAGQKEYQQLPINLNEIVVDVQQAIRHSFAREYKVILHLDEGLALVNGDYTGLKEILYNIWENAIEALTKDGLGRIEVTTGNCLAPNTDHDDTSIPDQQYVKISIKDNGTGIKGDNLQKIFDPYFSTRELCARRGMGLGMAIAFSIVKEHNGYIYIDSEEGVGTQVDIYLPAVQSRTLYGMLYQESSPQEATGNV